MLVQHFALCAAIHQVLKFLLAVDFDEKLRQFPQGLDRHHLAVHVGARAAVRADHPAHHDLAVVFHGLRSSQAIAAAGSASKLARHLGTLGSLAHHIAAGPAAGDEQQCIDDDGFAGAGLAGQRGEAAFELELRLIDEHQIAQLKMSQHGLVVRVWPPYAPRPQCSFERSSR